MPKLGPGTLTIGETGTEIDASCLVNNASITTDKDEGDPKTMLCGTEKTGTTTYTYTLSGNVDTDTDNAAGLFALSQAAAGQELPFVFTPSTEGGTSATGTLVMDPLDFGADEYGEYLNSDFEWALVGAPEYTYPETVDPEPEAFKRTVVNGRPRAGVKPVVSSPRLTRALSYEEIKKAAADRNKQPAAKTEKATA